MTTIIKHYYAANLECKYHRNMNGLFDMHIMEGTANVIDKLSCPRCGRFGTLKIVWMAEEPSYSVPISF